MQFLFLVCFNEFDGYDWESNVIEFPSLKEALEAAKSMHADGLHFDIKVRTFAEQGDIITLIAQNSYFEEMLG